MIIVEIPGRPPTPNETNRRVAQARWRERREWRATAHEFANEARLRWERRTGQKWETLPKAAILVRFMLPDGRRRDLDNLIASVKPLLDGIVDAGIIADDSTSCILTFSTWTELRPKEPGTIFEIGAPL